MLGNLGSGLDIENIGGGFGGLCGPFMNVLSCLDRAGVWVFNLGRDSPVRGRGSHGGSF